MHVHGHGVKRTSLLLQVSVAVTLAYIIVLVIAGVRANSLALLSEAGHNFSDLLALVLSWIAVWFQSRPADTSRTYGYNRAGVLAAFVNALTLIVIAGWIFWEAVERLRAPVTVQPRVMMVVAAIGVVLNGSIAFMLARAGKDVNLRSAIIHQIGDTLSTGAVIVGGFAISLTGQNWIDPALSFAIAIMVLWSSLGIMRETLNILLEGTPRGLHLNDIAEEMRAAEGVVDVHDLHVWSLGSEMHALSCHIIIDDIPPSASAKILQSVNDRLGTRFHIHHTTIQFEHVECVIQDGCAMPVPECCAPNSDGHGHTHSHDDSHDHTHSHSHGHSH